MSRKYFNYKGQQLQQLYEENKSDKSILLEIKEELEYRKTPSMQKLAKIVHEALNTNSEIEKPVVSEPEKAMPKLVKKKNSIELKTNVENEMKGEITEEFIQENFLHEETITNKSFDPNKFRDIGDLSDVPAKRSFSINEDMKLEFQEGTPITKKFDLGLKELITELKNAKNGMQHIIIVDGIQVSLPDKDFVYEFTFDGEADIFEGAKILAFIGGDKYEGRIKQISEGKITIGLPMDFGHRIARCSVAIDNTAILEALRERFEAIHKGEMPSFNNALAERVINNTGEENERLKISFDGKYEPLNELQDEAVAKALTNEVIYLWGPPGTGKTKTIGSLIRELFSQGKRTLIVSNTNQAVDQVLLKLCDSLGVEHEAINDGKVIRVGKITHEELNSKWRGYISEESVLVRKSEKLNLQLNQLIEDSNKLEVIKSGLKHIIEGFKELAKLNKEIESLEGQINKNNQEKVTLDKKKKSIETELKKLENELNTYHSANVLKRVFLRKQEDIQLDISKKDESLNDVISKMQSLETSNNETQGKYKATKGRYNQVASTLAQYSEPDMQELYKNTLEQIKSNKTEKDAIAKLLRDIKNQLINQALIVGATVTRTFLNSQTFQSFDTVIIDEASMIILPALYYASGLAKERVFVSGDDLQLQPILQSNQKAIIDLMGSDIMTYVKKNAVGKPKRMVMLNIQYRMPKKICSLIENNYLGGLRSNKETDSKTITINNRVIKEEVIIVDTSSIYPYVNRDQYESRYNVINAIIERNLCNNWSKDMPVGICTPYAAQSKLLKKVFESGKYNNIHVGTIHRYQGDQKKTMIIDIPDSLGEYNVGVFLEGDMVDTNNNIDVDNGTKLFNVAISRAESKLIFVCNLMYLDKKLPKNSYLRNVLYKSINSGVVIDAKSILALSKEVSDYSTLGEYLGISKLAITNGLFNEKDFFKGCIKDIEDAKKSVVIYSGFITHNRIAKLEGVIRKKVLSGVRVRCITRPPRFNGSVSVEDGKIALDSLEQMGCIVDTRTNIHQKVVIVDDRIIWFGSLNPLSHNAKTEELMVRIDDRNVAVQVLNFLSLDKNNDYDDNAYLSTSPENPRCPNCNYRVAYSIGKYGPFWVCEECGWKMNNSTWLRNQHK